MRQWLSPMGGEMWMDAPDESEDGSLVAELQAMAEGFRKTGDYVRVSAYLGAAGLARRHEARWQAHARLVEGLRKLKLEIEAGTCPAWAISFRMEALLAAHTTATTPRGED